MDHINVKFRVALAQKNLNQFRAALLTDLSPGEISLMFRGHKNPTAAQREKLQRLFTAKQIERIFGPLPPTKRRRKLNPEMRVAS